MVEVESSFVKNIRKVADKLCKEKVITLLMLIKLENKEDVDNRWTLVVSGPWVNDKTAPKDFSSIANELRKSLDKFELDYILNIRLFRANSPFVILMNRAFNVKNSIAHIRDLRLDGTQINEAYLFESKRYKSEKPKTL